MITIGKILRFLLPKQGYWFIKNQYAKKQLKDWRKNGCPVPPPHIVKQITIKEYQKKYKIKTLVETGTFMGDMIEAQKRFFSRIISIELDYDLFNKAKKKFKNDKNVFIYQGDSGKVLSKLLKDVNEQAIFWLDGHYSGGVTTKGDKECPIYEELDAIFDDNKLNHVILIDDERCFTGKGDYPTVEELTKYITNKNKDYKCYIKNDIIRFVVE